VYWHSFEGNLYLAATDGYRLSERRLVETSSDVSAIVPTQTLQEVLRLITDGVDEIEVLFDETQVRFRLNEAELVSRLIDGNFPDYRQLIPKETTTNAVVKKEDFVRITKIAGLFARESGGSITITLDSDTGSISIHSIASELGENTSEAAAKVDASGVITLNSRYVSDALSVLDSDEITFGFNGKLSASVFKANDKDVNYYHIVMPLKS
jgi:DNA polymerase-3 subunit beta